MGQRSDEIRQDIDRTRGELSTSLDVLGDRVSPRRVAQRRVSGMRGRLSSVRETVMGSPDGGGIRGSVSSAGGQAQDLTGRASDAASSAADQLHDAPEALRENVQGNPLAAGLIAFGGGLLLGSILPPSASEKRMASSVAENLEPVVGQAIGAAEELKSGMQHTVRDAAEEMKEQATGAAQEIKEEARGAAQDVKDQAKGSAEEMKDEAKGAAQDTASSARQQ